jgi:hypothetical protein
MRTLALILAATIMLPLLAQRTRPLRFTLIDDRTGKPFMLRSDKQVQVVYDAPHDVEWHDCNALMTGRVIGLDDQNLHLLYKQKELTCLWRDSVVQVIQHPLGYALSPITIPVGDVSLLTKARWGHEAASYVMLAGLTLALVIAPAVSYGYQGNWHDFNTETYQDALAAGLIMTGVSLPFYLAIPSQRSLRLR